ncbi:NUDIX hydrolase [Neobacillus mesonae]|uniref:NUDIX hydrolase n=1 Tax=Neobacillus mesonae TaxID=1193713 RepID=UPI00203B5430|nr:DNA mismatch repair protein MutT [Neobacillus mesonae]MCM3570628.1 DNA mismatch repair protein MutT [Neobacillus mesonae]
MENDGEQLGFYFVKIQGGKMTQNPIVLVVSVSIIKDERVLMIKENKLNVINKWNFSSGRIEPGEDILYAAKG